jgi:hypothetical protein
LDSALAPGLAAGAVSDDGMTVRARAKAGAGGTFGSFVADASVGGTGLGGSPTALGASRGPGCGGALGLSAAAGTTGTAVVVR